jgi:hypothetical protein
MKTTSSLLTMHYTYLSRSCTYVLSSWNFVVKSRRCVYVELHIPVFNVVYTRGNLAAVETYSFGVSASTVSGLGLSVIFA